MVVEAVLVAERTPVPVDVVLGVGLAQYGDGRYGLCVGKFAA